MDPNNYSALWDVYWWMVAAIGALVLLDVAQRCRRLSQQRKEQVRRETAGLSPRYARDILEALDNASK